MKKLITQILERLFEPTPDFFKKIRIIGVCLTAFFALVTGLHELGFKVPELILLMASKYTALAGLLTMFFASITSGIRDINGNIDPIKEQQEREKKFEAYARIYDK